MTAPRFLLHGIWLSGPTYKVALFLALAGEPFDFELVNLREGAHKAPGYVARQRYGQVPLLEDRSNGRGLCQAASILEYLADVTGKMGGATLDERIRAREWMFWDYDRFATPIYRCRGVKLGFRQAPEEAVAMCTAEGAAALAVLDGHLAGRDFVVGEGPTMADVDLYGVACYAEAGGFSLEALPALRAWMARVEALPGFGPPDVVVPKETRLGA
ncbi:glutathione S-transferase family protein [Salinarimonas sp. NSM]|uniref:glutathione S-transferase family protein n=1 Tax=Salinarimonas sp. NSM TaxID=3458003 RepID=UPI0040357405